MTLGVCVIVFDAVVDGVVVIVAVCVGVVELVIVLELV